MMGIKCYLGFSLAFTDALISVKSRAQTKKKKRSYFTDAFTEKMKRKNIKL